MLHPCPILCDPMNCSPPDFPVHGISQERMLDWVSISFSRGSSRPRDPTRISCATENHSRSGQICPLQASRHLCRPITIVAQLLSCVWLFATPWAAARQAFLSFTISWSLLKLMSIESVMTSNHLIWWPPFIPTFILSFETKVLLEVRRLAHKLITVAEPTSSLLGALHWLHPSPFCSLLLSQLAAQAKATGHVRPELRAEWAAGSWAGGLQGPQIP